jgi:S-adenosylmethionine synthetase
MKNMKHTFFTSESVTEGHPDKACDQIADGILDEFLKKDPFSRVACEVTAETDAVHIMGEITSSAKVDYGQVARQIIRRIGYTEPATGFDADTCLITCSLHSQSLDIALGVNQSLESKQACAVDSELGAGDQGMLFGYACNETSEMMPMPITLAHELTKKLAQARKEKVLPYLRPDGKAQVTVEYQNGFPIRLDTIVISTQHTTEVTFEKLQKDIVTQIIQKTIPSKLLDGNTRMLINPTGRFVFGGPASDSGLTGRKIIVDTYGGYAKHGGGSFSGKDPTKVDRSAAYMARYIAKNIVATEIAKRCEIQISYAIGVAKPVSLFVDTFGTGVVSDDKLCKWILKAYDMRPAAIIERFQLCRPIYLQTASYGHFGRSDLDLPWEKVDYNKTYNL